MSTLESYVPLIQAEAERLAQFLDTLSADDFQRPSACELWEIHDVVAHLIWGADFYADSVSRGLQGDTSLPENRPPGDTSDTVPMSTYFAQHAIRLREVLGDRLLPTFRTSYTALTELMTALHEQAWDTPCAFFPRYGQLPVRAFLLLTVQELVIHTWDIRSRFDASVALAADLLPLLLERIPGRFGVPDFAAFPLHQEGSEPVRYRWDVTGMNPGTYDVIVEGGKARMEPADDTMAGVTLRCDDGTFALLMYKRLTLEPATAQERAVVKGDQKLITALDEWLQQT